MNEAGLRQMPGHILYHTHIRMYSIQWLVHRFQLNFCKRAERERESETIMLVSIRPKLAVRAHIACTVHYIGPVCWLVFTISGSLLIVITVKRQANEIASSIYLLDDALICIAYVFVWFHTDFQPAGLLMLLLGFLLLFSCDVRLPLKLNGSRHFAVHLCV